MTCHYAPDDAAYVLGSLSAAERADFERHLSTCEECSRAVRELAGLPGLLAKVPADVLEPSPDREPVPATLLPSLVSAAHRDQRRRVVRTSLVAAAAVAVIAVGTAGVAAVLGNGDEPPTTAPPAAVETTAEPQLMTPVGDSASSGWISLTPVAWGTRLDLTCTYESDYGGDHAYAYLLVVTTTDGRVEQAGTWEAIPGKELHVTGAASVPPEDIASIEVQASDGHAVLRLTS
jgi:hypothetical protein